MVSSRVSTGLEAEAIAPDTEDIQRFAVRMNRIIGDLVDVVSIDAEKLTVLTDDCDCSALVSEAVEAFCP